MRPTAATANCPTARQITGNDPLNTSMAISPTFVAGWVKHLTGKYGFANAGGVRFYDLDNEPMLWSDTHRDVHPQPGQLRRDARPHLRLCRSREGGRPRRPDRWARWCWGWTGLFLLGPGRGCAARCIGGTTRPDRLAHGDVPFVEWYLQQMRGLRAGARPAAAGLSRRAHLPASGRGSAVAGRRGRDTAAAAALDALAVGPDLCGRELDRSGGGPDPPHARLGGETTTPARSWPSPSTTGARWTTSTAPWPRRTCSASSAARGWTWPRCGHPPTSDQPGAYAFRMYRNYDGWHASFWRHERPGGQRRPSAAGGVCCSARHRPGADLDGRSTRA